MTRNPEQGRVLVAQTPYRASPGTSDPGPSRWLNSLTHIAPVCMLVAVIAPVLSGMLLLLQAWWLAQILDRAISHNAPIAQLVPLALGIITLIAIRAFISWAGDSAASRGAEYIKSRVRQALFAVMMDGGPQWTRSRVSGELAGTLIDVVEALDGYFSRYLPSVAAAGFIPVLIGLVILPVEWVAGLLLLVTAPLIPVFMILVGWGAEAASRRHQQTLNRLSGLFADRLRGAFTLRLLSRTHDEIETVKRASSDLSRRTMAVLRIAFLSSAVLEFFAALGVAGVAVYIGLSYLGLLGETRQLMSLQTGLFCLLLAPEVYNPLRRFAANYHDRAAARAAAAQLNEVFGALPVMPVRAAGRARAVSALREMGVRSRQAAPCARAVPPVWQQASHPGPVLELRRLTVGPAVPAPPVVIETDLKLDVGQHVALMGHSGSGKTTLLEAICGWRDITDGNVYYGGRLLKPGTRLTVDDGVVLIAQQPFFAPATIAENLRLARPDATEDALWKALQQACAADFVLALPQALSTPLGVDGHGLSGGQRHRLALARLYLTDPALILLDEPTAHLDGHTRDEVMRSLREFAKGRAMVVATHDPAVASELDVVWRMQHARVVTS